MNFETSALNGDFGILIDRVTRDDLVSQEFKRNAYDLWTRHGGLLAVRGDDLPDITPEELIAWSSVFGKVENEVLAARKDKMVPGFPILRIGNIKDDAGKPQAQFAIVPPLENESDIRYNPQTRRPVWHTDSTFRQRPPIGSVFHCRQAPNECILPSHRVCAERQRNGYDCWKRLRHGGHGERYRRQKHQEYRFTAQDACTEKQRANHNNDDGQPATEGGQTPLERSC